MVVHNTASFCSSRFVRCVGDALHATRQRRMLPLLALLLTAASSASASPPQRAAAVASASVIADNAVTYCGESGRYASLSEAREAMLEFISKRQRCEAVAVGDWMASGSGAGITPGGMCHGKAFAQTYSPCGGGALGRFVFFESESTTHTSPAAAVISKQPTTAAQSAAQTHKPIRTDTTLPGLPSRVVLVNATPSAAMAR
jgi:hypothetical protein